VHGTRGATWDVKDRPESTRSQKLLKVLLEHMVHETRPRFLAYVESDESDTRLLNLVAFHASTSALMQEACESGRQVVLVWIDILKLCREFAMGGWIGVEALVNHVSKQLCEVAGAHAAVGRFDSRSFVMATLVSDGVECGRSFAQVVADRLIHTHRTESSPLDISVGVAFCPADTDSSEELLRFACLASVRSVRARSSSVVAFHHGMQESLQHDHEIESELRKAIENRQLKVAYQPKIDLVSGDVLGAEALVRWTHQCLGIIPPNEFIPVAERCGLIHSLFECVLRIVLEDTLCWKKIGIVLPVISVNASVASLLQQDFPFLVMRMLEEFQVAPEHLEIEVTESLLIEDESLFIERLQMLRQLGVQVAIDDFGTRYTGFDILSRLPLDTLKIDKCFVRGIDHSSNLRVLCQAIIAMARQLNMHTVAEGIEEDGELQVLQEIGCGAGQGFLFQRALPADQFTEFMHDWANSKSADRKWLTVPG